jgi:PTH2 family peptidyl-tRNA hydrolase
MANVQDRGPPSAAAVAIGTAIISGVTGYFLGQASSIGLFGSSSVNSVAAQKRSSNKDDGDDSSDSESEDEISSDEHDSVQDLGELKTFPGNSEECKLVLVVRTDLGMGKGRFACSYL